MKKQPYTIEHTPITLKELAPEDAGARILWKSKGDRKYGIYSHTDKHGAYIFFAGNTDPICMGLEACNEFFKAEVV